MPEYRDLMFVALDKGHEDVVTRLIQMGADWTLTEMVEQASVCASV